MCFIFRPRMSEQVPVYLHSKKVKDIPFCLLFILMIISQFFVAYLGIRDGNLEYLTKPYDSNHNLCGVNYNNGTDYSSKPYLYFIDPQKVVNGNSKSVCVNKCPVNITSNARIENSICIEGVTKSTDPTKWKDQVDAGNCTAIIYDSKVVLNRCVPLPSTVSKTGFDKSGVLNSGTSDLQIIFSDVITSYQYILIALAFSVLVAFLYLILLNYLTAIMTWISIVLGQLILIGIAVYAYFEYEDRMNSLAVETSSQLIWESRMTLAACIVFGVLALLYSIVLMFLRKRINVATEIIIEASEAVRAMKSLFCLPLFTGVLQAIVVGYFFIVAALLISTDRVPGAKLLNQQVYWYLQWYNLFGLLWGISFVYGFHQTVISGAVASWYWALNKKNLTSSPVFHSLMNVVKYSLGSVALGSLVLAIVRFLRAILIYSQRAAKAQKNKLLAKVLGCLACCLSCIEGLVKFMNKNTYVVVGIYGTSFCKSAKTAFGLLSRNAARMIAINAVSGFIIFVGKIFVSLLTTGLGYYFLRALDKNGTITLTFPLIPALLILLFSYVLSGVFFDIVDMAIGISC
eukprot:NODE_53_length_26956_cov_0.387348.p3 type:complete len:572 gc:universal NODE_53_length_26956_cov_0.387348:4300-6015(+)